MSGRLGRGRAVGFRKMWKLNFVFIFRSYVCIYVHIYYIVYHVYMFYTKIILEPSLKSGFGVQPQPLGTF